VLRGTERADQTFPTARKIKRQLISLDRQVFSDTQNESKTAKPLFLTTRYGVTVI